MCQVLPLRKQLFNSDGNLQLLPLNLGQTTPPADKRGLNNNQQVCTTRRFPPEATTKTLHLRCPSNAALVSVSLYIEYQVRTEDKK